MIKSYLKNQTGVAALLTVIIIAAAVFIMAFNSSLLGLGELELGVASEKASEALSIADSCAENALRRLRSNSSYAGETLNVGDGSCIINITGVGNDKTIIITSALDKYNKKIKVQATLNGSNTSITSWQELDN